MCGLRKKSKTPCRMGHSILINVKLKKLIKARDFFLLFIMIVIPAFLSFVAFVQVEVHEW